mmetsp:Transcript_172604/g.548060  ORF Transcript_172604/g.548060 Transcript_172604/m.548060 type:complete len:447 (+) Transcript_172604:1603-2943(+)
MHQVRDRQRVGKGVVLVLVALVVKVGAYHDAVVCGCRVPEQIQLKLVSDLKNVRCQKVQLHIPKATMDKFFSAQAIHPRTSKRTGVLIGRGPRVADRLGQKRPNGVGEEHQAANGVQLATFSEGLIDGGLQHGHGLALRRRSAAASASAAAAGAERRPRAGTERTTFSPALADTLLRLSGGWMMPEVDLLDLAETETNVVGIEEGPLGAEAQQLLPTELPPLRKLARSSSFNIALALDGRCFVWGGTGVLAAGAANRITTRPRLLLPPGEVAVDVAVGEGHAMILTERGRVWTFGWRHRSALGRGPRPVTAGGVATLVPGLERVVQIGAGATFSLCVDVHGSLWLFGEGPCIIGCFDDPLAVQEPRRVPASVFGGRRVLSAACGEGHVLVLTAWDPCCRLPQPGTWFSIPSRDRGEVATSEASEGAAQAPADDIKDTLSGCVHGST